MHLAADDMLEGLEVVLAAGELVGPASPLFEIGVAPFPGIIDEFESRNGWTAGIAEKWTELKPAAF